MIWFFLKIAVESVFNIETQTHIIQKLGNIQAICKKVFIIILVYKPLHISTHPLIAHDKFVDVVTVL